ncbi:MAG: helix-turn-helix transcriptional regulator [Deltaproteobacteria bacterium]|nr:helix-turn-helix transcriptional regulator [Deltaproteobacteria bacterium]
MNFVQKKNKHESAGDMLRFWRKLNKVSQMDLALDAGISSKHLSFVETGRSQPSRSLILKISDCLKLPLRQRNAFLMAAGFASEFKEEPFNGEKMEIVRSALTRMLEKHEPYPAMLINAAYDILMHNSGYQKVMKALAGEEVFLKHKNVYKMVFAENGLRNYIDNWPVVEKFMLNRLLGEAAATQNQKLFDLYNDVTQLRSSDSTGLEEIDPNMPVIVIRFKKDSIAASFFTTITTLGTPLDLTTQELRLELLFPADEETRRLFSGQT